MYNLLSFAEKFQTGGFTFILGVCVVFFGMIILVLAVSLMGKIMVSANEKKDKIAETKAETKVEAPQPSVSEDEIPEDVKVAIIAAISAYYMESGAKNEFKVRKIKKI